MATEVTLPELGESIEEGIVLEWLVAVGDTVEVDQPLLEISTDKIDTEIPSPAAGVVSELRAAVDDTINVGQVIAVIGESDAATAGAGPDGGPTETREATQSREASVNQEATASRASTTSRPATPPQDLGAPPTVPAAAHAVAAAPAAPVANRTARVSPIVRKMLREHNLTVAQVPAPSGQVRRSDVEAVVSGAVAPAAGRSASNGGTAAPRTAPAAAPARPEASPTQINFSGRDEVTEDLSRMRKAIAKAMMESLHSTAQLTAAVEVDVTALMHARARHKDAFKARVGASLSPLPMISRAAMVTIPRHPTVNSSIDTDAGTATFHANINLGMAVDTEEGLIVPVIRRAQDMTIADIASSIGDIAARARSKKLKPADLGGGTFTITNTGSRGTLFDTPILNPPEVAILATCAIEKRPVVVTDQYGGDSIAIRQMTYLCMSYDHRMLDGADAARFLQDLKWTIENHDWDAEITR